MSRVRARVLVTCHVSRVTAAWRSCQPQPTRGVSLDLHLGSQQPGRGGPCRLIAMHFTMSIFLPAILKKNCPVFLYFPPSNNFVKIDRKCSLQGPPLPQLVGAGHKYGKYGKVVRCCCVMLGPARPLLHTDEALSEENWSFCHFGQLILRRLHAGAGRADR